jgi:hypothetical protein
MKTRKMPYCCPVCKGSGEGPFTSTGLNNTLPPKCKACKGECILWGEEVDDSIDFSKITINPADHIPWSEPYNPWKVTPYPYIGDAPYHWSGNTWDAAVVTSGGIWNPATKKYDMKVVAINGLDANDCPWNFGF